MYNYVTYNCTDLLVMKERRERRYATFDDYLEPSSVEARIDYALTDSPERIAYARLRTDITRVDSSIQNDLHNAYEYSIKEKQDLIIGHIPFGGHFGSFVIDKKSKCAVIFEPFGHRRNYDVSSVNDAIKNTFGSEYKIIKNKQPIQTDSTSCGRHSVDAIEFLVNECSQNAGDQHRLEQALESLDHRNEKIYTLDPGSKSTYDRELDAKQLKNEGSYYSELWKFRKICNSTIDGYPQLDPEKKKFLRDFLEEQVCNKAHLRKIFISLSNRNRANIINNVIGPLLREYNTEHPTIDLKLKQLAVQQRNFLYNMQQQTDNPSYKDKEFDHHERRLKQDRIQSKEKNNNNINYELRDFADEIDNPPPKLRQTNQQQIIKQKLIEQKPQNSYSTIKKQLTDQTELPEIKRLQKSKMASNFSGVQDIKTTITIMDRQLSPAWLKQRPVDEQRYYSSLDAKSLRAHLDNLFETNETRYRNETIHQSTIHVEYFKGKIKKSDEFKIDTSIVTKLEENNTLILGGMGGIYKIDLTSSKPSPELVVKDPNMFITSIGVGNINKQKRYITCEANSNKVRIWDKDMNRFNQIEIPHCDKVITSVMGYKDKFVCVDRQGTVSVISSDGQVLQIPGLEGEKPGSQAPRLSQLSIKEGKLVRQDKEGAIAPEIIEDKIDKYFKDLEAAEHITPSPRC